MENLNSFYLSFIAGLISFFSPCILPLFPIYLTTLNNTNNDSKIFYQSIIFVFSFCSVFILLGLTATSLGIFLNVNKLSLLKISGSLIVLFGLFNIFLNQFTVLNKNFTFINSSSAKPLMLGLCFGLAWTPCVGPILASIISYSSVEKDYIHSIFMLTCYSLGLGVPFILWTLGMKNVFISMKNNPIFTSYYSSIMGIILIFFGYLVYNNKIYLLTIYVQEIMNFFT